jgi:hypothetical protein
MCVMSIEDHRSEPSIWTGSLTRFDCDCNEVVEMFKARSVWKEFVC